MELSPVAAAFFFGGGEDMTLIEDQNETIFRRANCNLSHQAGSICEISGGSLH